VLDDHDAPAGVRPDEPGVDPPRPVDHLLSAAEKRPVLFSEPWVDVVPDDAGDVSLAGIADIPIPCPTRTGRRPNPNSRPAWGRAAPQRPGVTPPTGCSSSGTCGHGCSGCRC
jgi:hypothetical protein